MSEKEGDEKRTAALETLAAVSERFPNLRVCQLIANATAVNDSYYVEDSQLTGALMAYLERHGSRPVRRKGSR